MVRADAGVKRRTLAPDRLSEELSARQLPPAHGWSEGGMQLAAEPTAWALMALRSSPRAAPNLGEVIDALLSMRQHCCPN